MKIPHDRRLTQRFALLCAAAIALVGCGPETPALRIPEIPSRPLDPALAQAVTEARSNLVAEPTVAANWGRLGQAFDAADFGAEAQQCYQEAGTRDPSAARWRHLQALRLLANDAERGIVLLEEAARLAGTTTDAPRLRWAQALVERGRFLQATQALSPLLTTQPAHAAARLEMGRAVLALGQTATAIEWLSPCVTNRYTARPAALLLSQAKLRSADSDAAARFARMAATMPKPYDWPDPFLKEVQALRQDRNRLSEQANQLLLERRIPDAELVISNLLTRLPNDPEGLLLLGRIRLQQRRCDEAEKALRQHLQATPTSLNGLVQLGMSQYCQSQWTEAAATFQKAIDLKPDFAQAHFNLGLAKSRAGDSASAIGSFREALRCNPGDANTHATLAEELFRMRRPTEATTHLERALSLEPGNPRARAVREKYAATR